VKNDTLLLKELAVYGNQTFSLVLAQIYELELISPDDSLIATLDEKWLKRNVQLTSLANLPSQNFPVFIKPAIPKQFQAAVFQSYAGIAAITNELLGNEPVLVSAIIPDISAEARAYVLNGVIKDIALYEGAGDLEQAMIFLESFLSINGDTIPDTVIIDLADSKERGWFILEFNACWGGGLNNCKGERVIACIEAATRNKTITNKTNA
ncbi:MAG: ATP-grasp domain-containing protein, partial [Chitinophagaceae bacterium]|nr:ATP-grasp domain-containing protein [Chitinophagaceae bacterium]